MANADVRSHLVFNDADSASEVRRLSSLLRQKENIVKAQERLLSEFQTQQQQFFICNICGYYGRFATFGETRRPNAACPSCGSFERTRYAIRALDAYKPLTRASSVLEIAPTRGTHDYFSYHIGCRYVGIDIDPEPLVKKGIHARRFDLCLNDPSGLGTFDLIFNVHVLEHVRCDPLWVIEKLNATLNPGGVHLISIPFAGLTTIEDMTPTLSPEERLRQFGHPDHQRAFGHDDFPKAMRARFGRRFGEFERAKFDSTPNEKFSLGLHLEANRLFYVKC